jgi:hypothetical protein
VPSGDIDRNVEKCDAAIDGRLGGFFNPWHAVWVPQNWIWLGTSLPYVFQTVYPTSQDDKPLPGFEKLLDDGDHVLLFPQDGQGLCPRIWFESAWSFLGHFRSNFAYYPQAAFLYKQITLIGKPVGNRLGYGPEVEEELRKADYRRVERIWITSGGELAEVLQRRIDEGVRFRDKDEGPGLPPESTT